MTTTKLVNPLDELFETEQQVGQVAEYSEVPESAVATLQAETPEIDEDDREIDRKIDGIHDAALETFQQQMQYAEMVEPRYAARNAEVAANYLNIALNAVATRAKVKGDRKKNTGFVPFASRGAAGTVVATREQILKMISIDAETKEKK